MFCLIVSLVHLVSVVADGSGMGTEAQEGSSRLCGPQWLEKMLRLGGKAAGGTQCCCTTIGLSLDHKLQWSCRGTGLRESRCGTGSRYTDG